jgi:phospholipid-binding lipoprotein MlaA
MSFLQSRARHFITAACIVLAALLSGCAHQNTRDPLEPLNRGIYTFNDAVDRAVLKPVAQGYRAVLPQFVRTGVSNFFSNLNDITVFLNNLLQLKIPQAASDTGRFLINTTIGVLGLFDVATQLGLEKHNEDFGQTLGYWGVGSGPFLMLPFLGPSSFRDGFGRFVDTFTDVVMNIDHIRTRNQFWGTRIVSDREHLLDSEKVLDTAAIDRYAFIRDAFLQRRRSLVHDGNPPPDPEDEDFNQNNKPRSELQEPPLVSTLVDQYGGIVAAPAASFEQQARTPADVPATNPASKGAAATTNDPTAAPAAARDPAAQPTSGSVSGASRSAVVRVWLPGSAAP